MGVSSETQSQHQGASTSVTMDAIRKKMQSIKAETDEMYAKINELQENIREANSDSDRFDAEIRDTGKRVQKLETGLEETMEKMMASSAKMEEAEKEFKDKDDDVNAQSRRVLLLEVDGPMNFTQMVTLFATKMAGGSDDDDVILASFEAFEQDDKIDAETFRAQLMTFGNKFSASEVDDAFAEFKIDDGQIDAAHLKGLMVSK